MSALSIHEDFMRAALQEASAASAAGDLPIGAVIVCDGAVVARGRNSINTGSSQLNHAEIAALANGSEIIFERHEDCVIYTTVEPCVMCLGTIVMADIRHVYFGVPDPRCGGTDMFRNVPYVGKEIHTYEGGILLEECAALAGDIVKV